MLRFLIQPLSYCQHKWVPRTNGKGYYCILCNTPLG